MYWRVLGPFWFVHLFWLLTCEGRFLSSYVSYFRCKNENGFKMWNFRGVEFLSVNKDTFWQFLWRPRPPSLLPPSKLKVGLFLDSCSPFCSGWNNQRTSKTSKRGTRKKIWSKKKNVKGELLPQGKKKERSTANGLPREEPNGRWLFTVGLTHPFSGRRRVAQVTWHNWRRWWRLLHCGRMCGRSLKNRRGSSPINSEQFLFHLFPYPCCRVHKKPATSPNRVRTWQI